MPRVADQKKRQAILAAALAVFQERGYAEARMAEIARRAQIASGTLYLYFPSKEALAHCLGDEYVDRLTDVLLPGLSRRDASAAITESVHNALLFAIQNRDLLRFVRFSLGPDQVFRRSGAEERLCRIIADALSERIERKELASYDPSALAELLSGLMQWMAEQILLDGKRGALRYEQTLIRLLQNALFPVQAEERKAREQASARH